MQKNSKKLALQDVSINTLFNKIMLVIT